MRLLPRPGPDGLAALVATPDELSSGERRSIALARVHLSPARLTVLDEAACHLDPAAEARAEAAFAARPGTSAVIAHCPASARRARRVLHLDGTDAELTVNRTVSEEN
ncbi:hypothetical protein ACIQBJ_02160 [Kitasatospora sp. NPDC088391]|uniref:hypothetical protein n=1 Tax=Kitasatospora sp. NPDC088391 TaxID=3364074 RepID=UPI0038291D86